MHERRRVIIEELLYDERSTPADRLKAAELLERLEGPDDEGPDGAALWRELSEEERDAFDAAFALDIVRALIGDERQVPGHLPREEARARYGLVEPYLRRIVAARAEERLRDLTDPERIEAEVERRARAMYERRAFRALPGGQEEPEASEEPPEPVQGLRTPENEVHPADAAFLRFSREDGAGDFSIRRLNE